VYHTIHKLMAGLLDVYTYCGNRQALEIAEKMAGWVDARSRRLKPEQWQRVLDVEFGGMNEALYNLYAITRNPRDLAAARRFDHEKIYAPLAARQDRLTGLHANTTIPKIIGAARGYEVDGGERLRQIADYFWHEVAEHRCYATGGTGNFEYWRTPPDRLAGELGPATQECCCSYNMLKLTRHVFAWTGDPRAADYYERVLFNSVLGTQDPSNGLTMYFLPLAGGYWKTFATPLDSFWCCTGTGVESPARFGEGIYFHDDRALWVNLFIASELKWPEKGLTLRQETRFPEQAGTALRVDLKQPLELTLRLRVPYWATRGASIKLNGAPLAVAAAAGSYAEIRRTWQSGDCLTIEMPMQLHLQPMPDNEHLAAILYGPLVLAGRLGALSAKELNDHGAAPAGPPCAVPQLVGGADPAAWIKPVAGKSLEFRTQGQKRNVTLVPLCFLFGQRYAVYWRITPNPPGRKP
jgi:DUF1680 family protein